ncbi:hypothetical protein [Lelliottia wanjuensis]|uniref:hypothetical protein n=1 Tax=Lelliottia wanjuensis TaxID=3050585 RepID=UPI00254DD4BD|nr:hypothetical protein [Lelliottia sp. V104_15]MDK9606635.1 hypothetical protein [Lelliottia sp. V104_15]
MEKRLSMLLVIQTLQMRGRAYARDIARRTGMKNEEAIAALLELEKRGKVEQVNGYWWLHVIFEAPAAGRGRKMK